MANTRSAWGIDIGNRALKAVKLVREGDRLRVDDVEVIEHEQILSSAGDNKDSFVQAALASFVQRHAIKGSIVGISVSGQSSFARFIKLPPVEPKKIPEIVKFEAIQQIPFPLEDVEWGYQLFQDPQSPDVEVGIFAMRKELVNAHIKQFTDLEMNVQVVQMGPLAVYNGMQYDQRLADGTTMIVDCGAENTDLIIADGETVWLRTISIGGNNFTESLTKSFKLNFPKAEELKRNAATSKYQRQIFQAMRPVFADLVSEIQRSIGFYGTVHRDSRIKRIIALGSTFRLPTLQKYLQQNLQVDVDRIDGFSGGAPSDGRLAAMLNENLISLGTAYGLAVQAMGDSKITSSLLPEPIRKAKIWKEKTQWFGIAAALFCAGTAGAVAKWYVDKQQYDSKELLRIGPNGADTIIKQANVADGAWTQTQENGATDRQRIKAVYDMRAGWDLWPKLITEIISASPPQPLLADKGKGSPRAKRSQIVIDSITPEYRSSMAEIVSASDNDFKSIVAGAGSTSGFTPGAAAAPANPARGYLIRLRCTTPNAGGSTFVQQNMLMKLLTLQLPEAIKGKGPYYIARATIVQESKVKEDTTRGAANTGGGGAVNPAGSNGFNPRPAFGRRDGFGRRGAPQNPVNVPVPTPTAPQDAAATVPFPDPETGEDMSEDWSLLVGIAVVLEPGTLTPDVFKAPAPDAAPAADAPAVTTPRGRGRGAQ